MILALRTLSVLALALAGMALAAAGIRWRNDASEAAWMHDIPDVADRLAQDGCTAAPPHASPLLVAQAEVFAARLNPPARPLSPPSPATEPIAVPEPPSLAATTTLRLHATSCYPDQPERSMALVSCVGAEPQDQRWVREGSRFASFLIHEIRRGEIVYRQGNQLHQVAIDHPIDPPSAVRNWVEGPERLTAAMHPLPTPAGPNDLDIAGN